MLERLRVFVISAACAALLAACSGHSYLAPSGPLAQNRLVAPRISFTEFADLPPNQYYFPVAITSGPGRALWVADNIDQDVGESAIARIDVTGHRTATFYYPNESSPAFADLVAGSDGAIWITDPGDTQILRYTTTGKKTKYPLPAGDGPQGIVSGPDGALWFVIDSGIGSSIGRLTTSGKLTLYSKGLSAGAVLEDIAAGPDGALWFTEIVGDRIGRITTSGAITEYSKGISTGAGPYSIAEGPDGALWFTEMKGDRIGRIATHGNVTEFANGISKGEHPIDIVPGPQGVLWFTAAHGRFSGGEIAKITTAGEITEYSGFLPHGDPVSIVAGPDGNMWFVEQSINRLGRANL